MIKKMTAIIAAAACASVIVTLVPGFAPEVAASVTQQIEPTVTPVARPAGAAAPSAIANSKATVQTIRSGSRNPKIFCAQSWPYYEQSCLRDGRKAGGDARTVRVVAAGRPATSQPGR